MVASELDELVAEAVVRDSDGASCLLGMATSAAAAMMMPHRAVSLVAAAGLALERMCHSLLLRRCQPQDWTLSSCFAQK